MCILLLTIEFHPVLHSPVNNNNDKYEQDVFMCQREEQETTCI